MQKAERLFQLINLLKGRRTAITAEKLAGELRVSVRTLYRDIQALQLSGMPIEGEAGVGYLIRGNFHLPPLMFDFEEMQALLLGCKMVEAFTDSELAEGAIRAAHKIRAVLPDHLLEKADQHIYQVPNLESYQPVRETHLQVRHACEKRKKLFFSYTDAQDQQTSRTVWPLAMVCWGKYWTLLSWCEFRNDYRHFRFDRIQDIRMLNDTYPHIDTQCLQHFLAEVLPSIKKHHQDEPSSVPKEDDYLSPGNKFIQKPHKP